MFLQDAQAGNDLPHNMGNNNSHDQKNTESPEVIGIKFIKRKGKKSIDQGKTSPPDQLKKPILLPFFLHRPVKLINPQPVDPINIPVANWFYKWEI